MTKQTKLLMLVCGIFLFAYNAFSIYNLLSEGKYPWLVIGSMISMLAITILMLDAMFPELPLFRKIEAKFFYTPISKIAPGMAFVGAILALIIGMIYLFV